MKTKLTIRDIAAAAVLTALTAILAQLSIPLPSGVPLTFQTFAIALCGYALGKRLGTLSVTAYVLLGIAGAPVLSNFTGGIGRLLGPTGGFIVGFLPMALLCGLGSAQKHIALKLIPGGAGILLCHAFGVLWYMNVASTDLSKAFLLVSVPYLVKDFVSVAAAYLLSVPLRSALRAVRVGATGKV
jgi:biotin transport system substrate-specific component